MTLRGTVEAVARALGVWWWESEHRLSAGLALRPDGSSLVWFHERDRTGTAVDDLTAALLLLGHARGLRVDLGECPACVARSGKCNGRLVLAMREWAHDREDNVGSTHGYRSTRWSARSLSSDGRWIDYPGRPGGLILLTRPCPSCTVDGKPTGRHTIPWAQALLDAMPPRVSQSARDWGALGQAMAAADVVLDGSSLVRTDLAVLADKMQGPGDPLGLWLAAWLGGPCHRCAGLKVTRRNPGARISIDELQSDLQRCQVCHGHGTLLGEHEPDLLAALEPLTWITDRLPKVGDRITVRHAARLVTGTVTDLGTDYHGLARVSTGGTGWWSNVTGGWRYA